MASGMRTAPDVTTAPSFKRLSWSVIGVNDSKVVTKSVIISAAATNVQIEALVVALQALTTASIFKVEVSEVFQGASAQSNATGDGRASVDDFLVLTGKNPALNATRRVYVPAPVSDIFDANSENIQTDDALITALIGAWDVLDAGFNSAWINFVEHSESNEKQTL